MPIRTPGDETRDGRPFGWRREEPVLAADDTDGKTKADCFAKFNNMSEFRGFPDTSAVVAADVAPPSRLALRRGRFRILASLIDEQPEFVLACIQGCIVVRAEHMWENNSIECLALCAEFDALAAGEAAPWYDVHLQSGKRVWERRAD